jgi:hypothetical protein
MADGGELGYGKDHEDDVTLLNEALKALGRIATIQTDAGARDVKLNSRHTGGRVNYAVRLRIRRGGLQVHLLPLPPEQKQYFPFGVFSVGLAGL